MIHEGPKLKVAVPNKGSLSEAAIQMLREAGYRQRKDTKDLVLIDEESHVEFYYLRPRDIAVYVGEGTLDVGITGRDMLIDSHAPADEIMGLGFGRSRFHFAAPAHETWTVADLADKRIATSYAGLLESWLSERGMSARIIRLDGAVEGAIRLGVADAIADVVETGTTLQRSGLEVFGEPIMQSEGILISRRGSQLPAGLGWLQRRLHGVLVARNYVMLDYDCPAEALDKALELTPGLESPTISPLARENWCAVRAMVKRSESQLILDDLWSVGARAILVTDIAACRL